MFAGSEDPVGKGRHERPLRAELQGHEVQSTWEVRQANQIAADFKADRKYCKDKKGLARNEATTVVCWFFCGKIAIFVPKLSSKAQFGP